MTRPIIYGDTLPVYEVTSAGVTDRVHAVSFDKPQRQAEFDALQPGQTMTVYERISGLPPDSPYAAVITIRRVS